MCLIWNKTILFVFINTTHDAYVIAIDYIMIMIMIMIIIIVDTSILCTKIDPLKGEY